MLAMRLDAPNGPLRMAHIPIPLPGENEILIKVAACGVCRADLHIVDGDLPALRLPLNLGHEVVGTVVRAGASVSAFAVGRRAGIPWLAGTCGHCDYCASGRGNPCDQAQFTGYGRDGGFAEYVVADARYCFTPPERYDDTHAAPLLCAGLIGYRAYAMTGGAKRLGLYGFGAAAHIMRSSPNARAGRFMRYRSRRHPFTGVRAVAWRHMGGWGRRGASRLARCRHYFRARRCAGATRLAREAQGATVVCAGIHMRDIPGFPYALLWGERALRSVANLTRADGEAFFALAAKIEIKTVPLVFRLEQANDALRALREGGSMGRRFLCRITFHDFFRRH